jgi:hypothetical protein
LENFLPEGFSMKFTPPMEVEGVLAAFASLFTRPTWNRAQALVCGAFLSSSSTITGILRMLHLGQEPQFGTFHRVLNRARWSAFKAVPILLELLTKAFTQAGEPLVFGLDETIERRWGKRITARAIYRDPVRSSMGCMQKTSALRWMSVHLLAPIHWAHRVWALPVLTALSPSERYRPFVEKSRRYKTLPRRARGLIGAIWRSMAGTKSRPLIFVADHTYAALELLAWCQRLTARCPSRSLTFVTRIRLDAALYTPAQPRPPGQKGRPRLLKGSRLPTLKERLKDPSLCWWQVTLPWYGSPGLAERTVEIASENCVWYSGGLPPVSIRWVLIRDPAGQFKSQALVSTNLELSAEKIVEVFVRRWQMEVTFEETNAHLGLPGQRQWNDRAIERSTPVRLALFSLVSLVANQLELRGESIPVFRTAWYAKKYPTFSDTLAAVRRLIWAQMDFLVSSSDNDIEKPPEKLFVHLAEMLCYAA